MPSDLPPTLTQNALLVNAHDHALNYLSPPEVLPTPLQLKELTHSHGFWGLFMWRRDHGQYLPLLEYGTQPL